MTASEKPNGADRVSDGTSLRELADAYESSGFNYPPEHIQTLRESADALAAHVAARSTLEQIVAARDEECEIWRQRLEVDTRNFKAELEKFDKPFLGDAAVTERWLRERLDDATLTDAYLRSEVLRRDPLKTHREGWRAACEALRSVLIPALMVTRSPVVPPHEGVSDGPTG